MRLSSALVCISLVVAAASLLSGARGSPVAAIDAPYEQVIADRYLFAGNDAECTSWPVLSIVDAQVVQSLPSYHAQSASGAWVVGRTSADSSPALLYFDIDNGTLTIVIDDMDCTAIITPTNDAFEEEYTAVALCDSAAGSSEPVLVLLACDPDDASVCKIASSPVALSGGNLTSGVIVQSIGSEGLVSTLYLGASDGLHTVDLGTLLVTSNIFNITEPVTAITYSDSHETVFVGTATDLFIYSVSSDAWRHEWVNALIDSAITSLTYDSTGDRLWIGQETGITLLVPIDMPDGEEHWLFRRLAGFVSDPGSDIGGLPFANITVLAFPNDDGSSTSNTSDGRVWLGGGRGLMRFDENAENADDRWRVFNSARYMPQREPWANISSLTILSARSDAAGAGNTAIGLAAKGLAVIRFEMWTLEQKAAHIQAMMDSGRHTWFGLVSDCSTPIFGDVAQCRKGPTDNDGLWTSIYLSSQATRYAVTQDPTVLESAWVHYEALRALQTVTGIYGYPARSMALRTDFPTTGPWHLSPTEPEWQFKGDTSSDEITGHEFIMPIVADLMTSNSSARDDVLQAALDITNNIVSNGLYLVGESGVHTRWGVWAPEQINDDPSWQEGRGTNSVQILSWLAHAYAVGPDANNATEYMEALVSLLDDATRYDVNMLNAKMIAVCDSNFSDDELTYMASFTLRHAVNIALKNAAQRRFKSKKAAAAWQQMATRLTEYMSVGLDLAQRYKVREKSPFYNALYCFASGQVDDQTEASTAEVKRSTPKKGSHARTSSKKSTGTIPDAPSATSPEFDCTSLATDSLWYLRRWPLEQVNWPQLNSDRLDLHLNTPAFGCRAGAQSLRLLPLDERPIQKWNNGPFELDGGDGLNEEGGGPFLSGYWMLRAFGLITAPTTSE